MRRLLALLFVLDALSWAVGGPVPFVPSVEGDYAPEGFAGFYSTPARKPSPGFAVGFFRGLGDAVEIEEFAVSAHGEVEAGLFRLSFLEVYHGLDSLFRQSYSELDVSAAFSAFSLGCAYGLSMEWLPGDAKWVRHRYKAGALALWRGFSFGAAVYGFTDEPVGFGGGVHWNPGGRFSAFAEGSGNGVFAGNSVRFEHAAVSVLYGFPDFSVSLRVDFRLGGWFAGGVLGSGDLPVWGVFSGKKLVK